MESIRQIQKKYCSNAMTTAIVAGFVLILAGQNAIAKGLVLGTIFSIVNFILMGEMLPLKLGKSNRRAFFWSLMSLLLRYSFVAIPLIVAIKFRQFNLFAVVGGIFLVQVMILAESLLTTLSSFRNKQA
ncbi:MAG: ATP synthase subunit I [Desulfobacterales bacterium]|nr:ATP synthase subunit I [Desulfobacterales bacterium]